MIVVNNGSRFSTDYALRLLLGFTEPFMLILRHIPSAVRLVLPVTLVLLVCTLPAQGGQSALVALVQLEMAFVG